MKTFEHIITDKLGQDCDKITFNGDGIILIWEVWSEACNAYIEVPTHLICNAWPSKFENVQDKIYELADAQVAV